MEIACDRVCVKGRECLRKKHDKERERLRESVCERKRGNYLNNSFHFFSSHPMA
jgi:hypothetical protein